METRNKLPYLIDLLDDETPEIRKAVLDELRAFGPGLESALAREEILPDQYRRGLLRDIITENRKQIFLEGLHGIAAALPDARKLEQFFQLVADFQRGGQYQPKIDSALHELTEDYLSAYPDANPFDLANFLFQVKEIKGAEEDYYNPGNSDLLYVIAERRGIPISMCCLYMLLAARMGIAVAGVNFPGHFLASFTSEGEKVLVDCYNGGRFIFEGEFDLLESQAPEQFEKVMQQPPDADNIIKRVLFNLVNAYGKKDDTSTSSFFYDIILNDF